jgi:hypothetical protein
MDLKFDKRSVLLPVGHLVSGIANGSNYQYKQNQREAMVQCVVRDVLESLGGREDVHSLDTPKGRLCRHYSELTRFFEEENRNSSTSNTYNGQLLQNRVRDLLAKHSLYEACAADNQSVVNTLGAGYEVMWFWKKGKHLSLAKKHLVITWTRPRLDHQSMDIVGFIDHIVAALVKKKYQRERVVKTINAIPLRDLLSSYPIGAMAEDIREHPHQTWEGLLQFVISRLKGV